MDQGHENDPLATQDYSDDDMALEDLLKLIPSSWVWSIEQPRFKGIARVPGKKKPQQLRYTVFVANDKTFGTKGYFSTFADSDDYCEALKNAYDKVIFLIKEDKENGKNNRTK